MAGQRGLQWHVVEALGIPIATGELRPDTLLVLDEIMHEHEVSRGLVREVLKVLEGKGMVRARQNIGTKVTPQTEWDLLDADVIRWRAAGPEWRHQLGELLALRGAIEPLAVRGCCDVMSEQDLVEMDADCDAMAAAVTAKDRDAFTEADVRFHRRLLDSCDNAVFRQLGEPIEAALRVRHGLDLVPRDLQQSVVVAHRKIVTHVRAGDAGRAEAALRRIVSKAGAEISASERPADPT